jgi:hypothetical protein
VRGGSRTRAALVLLAAMAVTSRTVSAQVDEGVVKAVTLVKVGLFVDWPTTPASDRFVIGIAGDAALADAVMHSARGQRLRGRDVKVLRLGESDTACACQVLFIGARDEVRSAALLAWAGTRPVLTVGETTSFLREGGIIRIFREDDRLRMQINSTRAEAAGLRISSRLLQLSSGTP